jgi:glutamyl-tRNA reductase
MSRELHVIHCHEASHELPAALAAAAEAGTAMVMHTCQRTVAISTSAAVNRTITAALAGQAQLESYAGAAAYGFLLRMACGLESKLAGETEIFGQVKETWAAFSVRDLPLARELGSTVQRLFRDVKQVRSLHLSGIGSASYGSMVRRLLDNSDATGEPRPVLLIGAGQIAHAVAPWIKGSELWIWNRSADKAQALAVELQRRAPGRVIKVLAAGSEAELAAWHTAHDVVVCIPADGGERDAARAQAWTGGGENRGRLIHLGVDGSQPLGVWSSANRLLHLADVYQLLRESNEQRKAQIERARIACDEMARQWQAPRAAQAGASRRLRAGDQRVS